MAEERRQAEKNKSVTYFKLIARPTKDAVRRAILGEWDGVKTTMVVVVREVGGRKAGGGWLGWVGLGVGYRLL